MSRSLVVPVVTIENVRPHSNADKLELCDVLGYQMCVPKGRHTSGEKVVYFPADTLIPGEWADKFGVRKFLRGADENRVGKVRLRGEPSFGLVIPIPEGEDWEVGDNVAEHFGCEKYEPPVKTTAGDAAAYDERIDAAIDRYTDIENGRIFTEVFMPGEEVVVTEKIHGTNCRVGLVKDVDVFAASMSVRRKRPLNKDGCPAFFWDPEIKNNTYWHPWSYKGVGNLISALIKRGRVVVLYGEVFGGSIQSLNYGINKGKGVSFRAFDLSIDGKYLDWDEFSSLCDEFEVPTVPVLYRGPFAFEQVAKLADGSTTVGGDHIREGVVVKPVKERIDPKIGRAVLKYIGTEYELSKHADRDTKDT